MLASSGDQQRVTLDVVVRSLLLFPTTPLGGVARSDDWEARPLNLGHVREAETRDTHLKRHSISLERLSHDATHLHQERS